MGNKEFTRIIKDVFIIFSTLKSILHKQIEEIEELEISSVIILHLFKYVDDAMLKLITVKPSIIITFTNLHCAIPSRVDTTN